MKHILASTVITSGLLAFSPLSNAATFNFQAWILTNGEQGFDNSSPFALTDAGGLTLTATAFENPGMTNSYVYMDDSYNGIIGGMGVCSELTITGNQCAVASDDNVSTDGINVEILTWSFSQDITELTLELGDNDHYAFAESDFEYRIGDGAWLIATTDVDAIATLLLTGGGDEIAFRSAGGTMGDHFYIRNADASVVPIPAAVWLFGSGLLGLVGIARRKKA